MSTINQPKTEKSYKPFTRNCLIRIGIAVGISSVFIFAIFVYREYIPNQPQPQLEIEYKKIVPFSNSSVVKYDTSHTASETIVGASYLLLTNTSISDIVNYYGEQLRQQGWQAYKPNGDIQVNTWYYCKDGYLAELYYMGNFAGNDGWTYRLHMIWSLKGCETIADEGGLFYLTH